MSVVRLRLVIDTNVLISALLNPDRTPDRALAAVRARRDVVLYDDRVLAEYRDVLGRKKFQTIDRGRADAYIEALVAIGEGVACVAPYDGAMIDEGDRVFVEVALAGKADALVTGNARHYPTDLGFEILAPAELAARLA